MGWFNNSKENKKEPEKFPSLPELPELPDFSDSNELEDKNEIHKLPSFPSSSLGNKFSQNAIKEAVSGEEGDEEVSSADEFSPPYEMKRMKMMPQKPLLNYNPQIKSKRLIPKGFETKQYNYVEPEIWEIPSHFSEAAKRMKRTEPLFIRIDKFEESIELFSKIKNKISEIDKMLMEIKQIKEDEEKEIITWEREIQIIKKQIEKIDSDIFSKIE